MSAEILFAGLLLIACFLGAVIGIMDMAIANAEGE